MLNEARKRATHFDIRLTKISYIVLTNIDIAFRDPYFTQRDFENVYSIFQSLIIHKLLEIIQIYKQHKLIYVILHFFA